MNKQQEQRLKAIKKFNRDLERSLKNERAQLTNLPHPILPNPSPGPGEASPLASDSTRDLQT